MREPAVRDLGALARDAARMRWLARKECLRSRRAVAHAKQLEETAQRAGAGAGVLDLLLRTGLSARDARAELALLEQRLADECALRPWEIAFVLE